MKRETILHHPFWEIIPPIFWIKFSVLENFESFRRQLNWGKLPIIQRVIGIGMENFWNRFEEKVSQNRNFVIRFFRISFQKKYFSPYYKFFVRKLFRFEKIAYICKRDLWTIALKTVLSVATESDGGYRICWISTVFQNFLRRCL